MYIKAVPIQLFCYLYSITLMLRYQSIRQLAHSFTITPTDLNALGSTICFVITFIVCSEVFQPNLVAIRSNFVSFVCPVLLCVYWLALRNTFAS